MVKFKESYHAPGTNINGKLPREEPGAKRPRTRVATFSASRGRERVLPGGFLSLGAERSSQCERKPESFQVLENGGFWSGVATRRREEVEIVPSDKNSLSQGLWLSVASVREETPAGNSGLRSKDLVTRWNLFVYNLAFNAENKDQRTDCLPS